MKIALIKENFGSLVHQVSRNQSLVKEKIQEINSVVLEAVGKNWEMLINSEGWEAEKIKTTQTLKLVIKALPLLCLGPFFYWQAEAPYLNEIENQMIRSAGKVACYAAVVGLIVVLAVQMAYFTERDRVSREEMLQEWRRQHSLKAAETASPA